MLGFILPLGVTTVTSLSILLKAAVANTTPFEFQAPGVLRLVSGVHPHVASGSPTEYQHCGVPCLTLPLQDCHRSGLREHKAGWCADCSIVSCGQRHATDPVWIHAAPAQDAEPPAAGSNSASTGPHAAGHRALGRQGGQRQLGGALRHYLTSAGPDCDVLLDSSGCQHQSVYVPGPFLSSNVPGPGPYQDHPCVADQLVGARGEHECQEVAGYGSCCGGYGRIRCVCQPGDHTQQQKLWRGASAQEW